MQYTVTGRSMFAGITLIKIAVVLMATGQFPRTGRGLGTIAQISFTFQVCPSSTPVHYIE